MLPTHKVFYTKYFYYFRKSFTDVLSDTDEICDSQPLSLSSAEDSEHRVHDDNAVKVAADSNIACNFGSHSVRRPAKGIGQHGEFRSVDEIGKITLFCNFF